MTNEIKYLTPDAVNFLEYEGAVDSSDCEIFFNHIKTAEPLENFKFVEAKSKIEKVFGEIKITVFDGLQAFKGDKRGTFIYVDFQNDGQNIILKQF